MVQRDQYGKTVRENQGASLLSRWVYHFESGSYRASDWTETEYRAILKLQEETPVSVGTMGARTWWLFRKNFYLEDEGRTAEQIKEFAMSAAAAVHKPVPDKGNGFQATRPAEAAENEWRQIFQDAHKSPIPAKQQLQPPTFDQPPRARTQPEHSPQPEQLQDKKDTSEVQKMGESVGAGFSQPFEGKGQRLDGWAELVEDASSMASELIRSFQVRLNDRAIPGTDVKLEDLTAPGLIAERRRYFLITRDVAMVAVYIAGLGKDLYISWVLYGQGEIALSRVVVLALLAALVSAPSGFRVDFFIGTRFDASGYVTSAIIAFIILLVIVGIVGYIRHRDPNYYLRSPLNEFQQDDLLALALAVHKSLLHAIDSVGIDTKILRAKEQFGSVRGRLI